MLTWELCTGRAWKCAKSKNINFRLTSAAQKRLCLSSVILLRYLLQALSSACEDNMFDYNPTTLYRSKSADALTQRRRSMAILSWWIIPKTTAVESTVVIVMPDACANGQRAFAREQWGKRTWEFIVKSLVGVTSRVFKVPFRHVTRTVSEKYQTSHCLRDKQWTDVLVMQSWRSFPSPHKTALCVTGSQGKSFWQRLLPSYDHIHHL